MSNGRQGSDPEAVGNPNLVYVSEFIEGWEPSGVPVCGIHLSMPPSMPANFSSQDAIEVTRCTGIDELSS